MSQQRSSDSLVTRQDGSREETLADLFVALADTLVADFDVIELLDRLVGSCVELFDVSAAGVLIMDARGNLRLVASSDERAEALEVFQVQANEGPCLDCARSRTPVSVPILQAEHDRWPKFCAAADIVGFHAVHATPLRLRGEALGTLGLFHAVPTELTARDLHTVQALADVATIGILQQQHALQSSIMTGQLQGALNSRVAIEQAKGIVAEKGNIPMAAAYAQLRRYCRDHNLKLSDVAQAVANREMPAATILGAARKRQP